MKVQACGNVKSFKRLITPANKPQGFGFAEFEDPDGALRAMALLNNVELPALEDGCVNKKLLVRHDDFLINGNSYHPSDQSRRKDQGLSRCLSSPANANKRASSLHFQPDNSAL
jgi:RNA recognition motif-containing protein